MPKICRTCLKQITSSDFINIDSSVTTSLNSVVVKQELAICIPEMDLNLVANPIVCNPCVNDLHAAYDFKRKCLQTEERIHTYVQTNTLETTCIELSQIIGSRNENTPRTTVKLEPDATQRDFDEDLDGYGDNLEFDSSMDCVIKSDPTSTFTHSNDTTSNSEDYTEQSYSDFTFSNENVPEFVSEFPTQESDTMKDQKKPFKCGPCKFTTTDEADLMKHIQSHMEQSTTSLNVVTSKRRTFTIEDKMDIIRMMQNGTKMAEVCRRTGLATSTVCCIMKKKDVILNAFAKNGHNMKRLRKPRHADVDEVLLAWCKEQQSLDVALSGPIIRVKAEELARSIGNYEFVCTNGWLERFRTRYNICVGKRNREVKLLVKLDPV